MDTANRENQETSRTSQKDSGASQAKVLLLVDDNFAVRSSLKTWLAYVFPQIKILEADCGESALALFDFVTPTLILMDVALPGMSGIEAARRVNVVQPESRIVMLSFHDEPQYQNDAQRAGAFAFFSKSEKITDLLPTLKEILGPDKNLSDQLLEE